MVLESYLVTVSVDTFGKQIVFRLPAVICKIDQLNLQVNLASNNKLILMLWLLVAIAKEQIQARAGVFRSRANRSMFIKDKL